MTDQSESAATNRMIRDEVMDVLANRMGLDRLPLSNPNINFFRVAKAQLQEMGWSGQDLDYSTYRVIGDVVRTITGKEGKLFHYPDYSERQELAGKKALPFDQYFRMSIKQRGKQFRMREMEKQGRLPGGFSITPGRAEDFEGEITEGMIPGGVSGEEEAARADQLAKQARVFAGIPRLLADKQGGESLVLIWDMLKSGNYTLKEMAEALEGKQIPTIEGGPWTTGVVHRAKIKIMNFVQQYLQIKGIDWGSFEI